MPVYVSPFEAPVIPEIGITELVFRGVETRNDDPVLIEGPTGRVITGREFIDRVRRLAGGLAARGIGPGHVVALMAPNIPEFAIVFHAVALCGATLTTINPTYTAREVRLQLIDARAELLIAFAPFIPMAREAAEGTTANTVVSIGPAEGVAELADLFGPPMMAQVPLDFARDVLVLPYSSGTTGLPKGVMLSHRNLVANALQTRPHIRVDPGDAILAVLPFFHIYGMSVLMNHFLSSGGVVVTLPRFELEPALRLIERHRTPWLIVVPPIILALAKHPMVENFDLSGVRSVISGAAPLGAELQQACTARLGATVVQGYGLTETSPVSHVVPVDRVTPGAAGFCVGGTEMRLVDPETGVEVPDGREGEIHLRGPQVMLGYLDNPEATAAALLPGGWFRTGDLGYVDGDGHLHIVDRVKELIKVKGFQVAPAELEALLIAHPEVADVAVVGAPDEESGERPVAFVVRAQGATIESAALVAYLQPLVAHYKQLSEVRFVEAIPKSPSGKILRRMLKATP